ncbi:MAG: COG4223 family protein [Rubrimonas sp.]
MTGEKRPDEAETPGTNPQDPTSGATAGTGGMSFDPWAAQRRDETPDADQAAGDAAEETRERTETPEAAADPAVPDPEPVAASAAEPEPAAQVPPPPPPAAPARKSGGFAGRALNLIVVLIAGGLLALWAGPKVANMMPAPVAAWLRPASPGLDMAQVEAAIAARLAAADPAAALSEAEAARAAAQALAAEVESLRGVVQTLESRLALAEAGGGAAAGAADGSLIARIEALEAGGGGDGAELRADMQALEAALAAIAARMNQTPDLSRLGEVEATLRDAAELTRRMEAIEAAMAEEAAARESAVSAAERARLNAQLSQALLQIDRAMIFGEPFRDALQAAAAVASVPPPQALVDASAGGAPTREALKASFPDAAYNAISAALAAEADRDDSMVASVLARLEARFTGLPGEPIAGDSAPAVLSRARDALLKGDIDSALAGIEALPSAAREAMAPWAEAARMRSEADVALKNWRAELGRAD